MSLTSRPDRVGRILAAACAMMLSAALAGPVLAAAPAPAKAVDIKFYSGRWYEIARTPNSNQRDCEGATSDFTGGASGRYTLVQTCRKGSVSGPKRTFKANGEIVPNSRNAKIKMKFFGGVVSQEYWILDRAADHAWVILGTDGGNYVWLLSRRPVLEGAVRAAALGRLQSLGFGPGRLDYPKQPPAP